MAESKRMVSGKIGEKLVCLPTQSYDAPSGQVGNFFVSILAVELDVIQDQKWNSNRVIVFQSVIVQLIQLATGTNNICAQTDFGIDCWNHGTFGGLLNNTYTTASG